MRTTRNLLSLLLLATLASLTGDCPGQDVATDRDPGAKPGKSISETAPVPEDQLKLIDAVASIRNTDATFREVLDQAKAEIVRVKEEIAAKMAEVGKGTNLQTSESSKETAKKLGVACLDVIAALQRCKERIVEVESQADLNGRKVLDQLVMAVEDGYSGTREGVDVAEYQQLREEALRIKRQFTDEIIRLQEARRRIEALQRSFVRERQVIVVKVALDLMQGRLKALQDFVRFVEQAISELESLLRAPLATSPTKGSAEGIAPSAPAGAPRETPRNTTSAKERPENNIGAAPSEVVLVGTPVPARRSYYSPR